jgi:hypothetical protein
MAFFSLFQKHKVFWNFGNEAALTPLRIGASREHKFDCTCSGGGITDTRQLHVLETHVCICPEVVQLKSQSDHATRSHHLPLGDIHEPPTRLPRMAVRDNSLADSCVIANAVEGCQKGHESSF